MTEKEEILFKYGKIALIYYFLYQLIIGSLSRYIYDLLGTASYSMDEVAYSYFGISLVGLLANIGLILYLKSEIDRSKPLGWVVIAMLLLLPYFGIVTLASWKLLVLNTKE